MSLKIEFSRKATRRPQKSKRGNTLIAVLLILTGIGNLAVHSFTGFMWVLSYGLGALSRDVTLIKLTVFFGLSIIFMIGYFIFGKRTIALLSVAAFVLSLFISVPLIL